MPFVHLHWLLCGLWISILVVMALAGDIATARGWLLLVAVTLIPTAVLLRRWHETPPRAVAEVLHSPGPRR